MAKDEQSNQLNLTVVALVALVAIVGLVALVMNAASITPRIVTGSQVVSAADDTQNVLGDAKTEGARKAKTKDVGTPSGSGGSGGQCKTADDCRCGETQIARCQINWFSPNQCVCQQQRGY